MSLFIIGPKFFFRVLFVVIVVTQTTIFANEVSRPCPGPIWTDPITGMSFRSFGVESSWLKGREQCGGLGEGWDLPLISYFSKDNEKFGKIDRYIRFFNSLVGATVPVSGTEHLFGCRSHTDMLFSPSKSECASVFG